MPEHHQIAHLDQSALVPKAQARKRSPQNHTEDKTSGDVLEVGRHPDQCLFSRVGQRGSEPKTRQQNEHDTQDMNPQGQAKQADVFQAAAQGGGTK